MTDTSTDPRDRLAEAEFIGGPLDGARRLARLRHALDDDAGPMSYNEAGRYVHDPIAEGRPGRRGYIHTDGGAYVHVSVYCEWANDPTPAEARAVGITDRRWPYGPNICPLTRRRLVDWATAGGYRLASPRRGCLHWVLGQSRRCSHLQHPRHSGRIDPGSLFDHPTYWSGPAGRFLLAQPYTPPERADYDDALRDWPVTVEFTGPSPWYGVGTYGVIVRPSDEAGITTTTQEN